MFSSKSYVDAITPDVMVFGDKTLRKLLRLDEVMKVDSCLMESVP